MTTLYGYFLSSEEHPPQELAGRRGAGQMLPLPRQFAQLTELVTEDMVSASCGPDAEGLFDFYARQVLPRLREG